MSGGLVETTFFSRTYDDAIALVQEARDYLSHHAVQPRDGEPWDRLVFNCESLRLTTRLAQVMAWLLAQRALHAGEISLEEARSDTYRLEGGDVCLEADPDMIAVLPAAMRSLMERSLKLYQRVARLDGMVRRDSDWTAS